MLTERLITLGARYVATAHSMTKLSLREAAAIAFLALARRPVGKSVLSEHLWSTSSSKKARHSLNQLVYSLRRKVGDDILIPNSSTVELGPVAIDFVRMLDDASGNLHIATALGYTGRFLGPEDISDDHLADWRDSLDARFASVASEHLHEWYQIAKPDDYRAIARQAEVILALHPEYQGLKTLLLDALMACGEQEAARVRHAAFQVDPDFTGHPQLDVGRAPLVSTMCATPIPPFVGRVPEVQILINTWQQVREGDGRTVIVEGEPGIGKTRLAHHVLRRIAISGGRVWSLACNAATQRIPYSGIADLLRDNATNLNRAVEFPDLSMLLEPRDGLDNSTIREKLHVIVQQATELIARLSANQPLTVFVDDAQWADEFTGILLTYWAYRLQGHPVLLLLVARTQEPDSLPSWLANDITAHERLQLTPLARGESEEIVNSYERAYSRPLPSRQRRMVLEQTGGRPYLLIESLAELTAAGEASEFEGTLLARTAESMLRRRLMGLGPQALELAGVLATLGKPLRLADLDDLCTITGTSIDALDSLTSRDILTWRDGQAAFPHDLMRETVYRSISPVKKTRTHAGVAAFLAAYGADDSELAPHYAAAGDASRAGQHALRASEHAFSGNLLVDAEHFLRFTIAHGSQDYRMAAARKLVGLLVKTGRVSEVDQAMSVLGDRNADTRVLREIVEFEKQFSRGNVDITILLQAASKLLANTLSSLDPEWIPAANTLFDLSLDAAARQLGNQVLGALDETDDENLPDEVRLQLKVYHASWVAISRSYEEASEYLNEWQWLLTEVMSPSTHALCHNFNGLVLLLSGRPSNAQHEFDKAFACADRAGDLRRSSSATVNASVALMESGNLEAAQTRLITLINHPSPHIKVRSLANLAVLHIENGHYQLAIGAAERLLAVGQSYGSGAFIREAHALIGTAHLALGDLDSARRSATAIPAQLHDDLVDFTHTAKLLAKIYVANGEAERALLFLSDCRARLRRRDRLAYLRLGCIYGEIALMTGQNIHEAFELASEILAEANEANAQLIVRQCNRLLDAAKFRG